MKKFLAALFTTLSLAAPSAAWEVKEMNQHIDQTNFIVGRGCSGTLIDLEERLILTNHHCVVDFIKFKTEEKISGDGVVSSVRVTDLQEVPVHQRTYNGHKIVSSSTYVTEIKGWDEEIDLALLQFRSENLPFTMEATLSTEPVQRGEVAWVVGNPLGFENTVMKGVVSSVNRLVRIGKTEIPYIQVDAGVTGGNSGGALYNDNGIMIGVPGAAARGTVVGLAIPGPFILEFLDEFCYTSVYDASAESYEDCMKPKKKETEE